MDGTKREQDIVRRLAHRDRPVESTEKEVAIK